MIAFRNFTRVSLSSTRKLSHLPSTFLSEDEQFVRESIKKFAESEIQPIVQRMDREMKLDDTLLKSLFNNGYMGIEVPTDYGGSGMSFFDSILIIEEISKADPSVGILVDIQNTLITALFMKLGNTEQKDEWLPKLATDTVGSFCLSEQNSGSDAFALKTKAIKDGDSYILNGSKLWISNSEQAGVFLVLANAEPEKGYKGITMFIIPRDSEGLSIGKKESKLGLRASSTCAVNLDNVRVSAKNGILGEVGKGYRYAIEMLNEGRIGIAAQMLGLASGCLEFATNYTFERKQFGKRIWDFQAVQHDIAKLECEIVALRALIYNTARKRENKECIRKDASVCKYLSANIASAVCSKSIELLGGVGFSSDYPIEKYYRDVKIGTIYEGTNNIQLNSIAKCLEEEMNA